MQLPPIAIFFDKRRDLILPFREKWRVVKRMTRGFTLERTQNAKFPAIAPRQGPNQVNTRRSHLAERFPCEVAKRGLKRLLLAAFYFTRNGDVNG